jgi:hypothetical protein
MPCWCDPDQEKLSEAQRAIKEHAEKIVGATKRVENKRRTIGDVSQ